MYTYTYMYIYVFIYVYIHMYIYIYIQICIMPLSNGPFEKNSTFLTIEWMVLISIPMVVEMESEFLDGHHTFFSKGAF